MHEHRDAIVAFLKRASEKSGLTLSKIAEEIGVSHTTLTRPVTNPDYKYLPKIGTLTKVATLTGVDLPAELTISEPGPSSFERIKSLQVRGVVAAGMWQTQDAIQDQAAGEAPMVEQARYSGVPQWAEIVRGESMNKTYEDGDFLHVVDAATLAYSPIPGDDVVVEQRSAQDGMVERTCKRIALVDGKFVLVGDSRNEHWNQPLPLGGGEDTVVQIVGLVIGSYRPRRR